MPAAFVFYDSRVMDCFLSIFRNGRIMEFKRASYGLYYSDLHNFGRHEYKVTYTAFRFLTLHNTFNQTVSEREALETKNDLDKAKLAREYEILMYPSSGNMKKILS